VFASSPVKLPTEAIPSPGTPAGEAFALVVLVITCVALLVKLVMDWLDKRSRSKELEELLKSVSENGKVGVRCEAKAERVRGHVAEILAMQRDIWYVRDRLDDALKSLVTSIGNLAEVLRDLNHNVQVGQERSLDGQERLEKAIKEMDERVRNIRR